MSYRVTYKTLLAQGKKVAYMNPPGGIFTYVCGLVVNKNAKNYDKALALVDSSLSDDAAHYIMTHIGDGPANIEELKKEPAASFQRLGIPRDVETFLNSGILQKPLKNKDQDRQRLDLKSAPACDAAQRSERAGPQRARGCP